jgi:propanol-preferring alcohol dehydrogenase
MQANDFTHTGSRSSLTTCRPTPGPGQVVIRVEGAGFVTAISTSFRATSRSPRMPFTLGHENAGTVAGIGAGVMQ